MKPVFELAPLHGVTGYAFRNAFFARFPGFDSALAPFIIQLDKPKETRIHFRDVIPANNIGIALVPQLLGNDPQAFVKTAKLLEEIGYEEINLNLGCPFARVANKFRGSGLLPYPDRIKQILDVVCSSLQASVSVKLRLGRYDASEIMTLMPILNALPLKRLIIHPRIGLQMYTGMVDLEGFKAALLESRHPVVYNGDIRTAEDYNFLKNQFPQINEWMIGRSAVADPFLIGKITTGTTSSEPLNKLLEFHDELFVIYSGLLCGPGHLLDKMKELWRYFGQSLHKNTKELRNMELAKTIPEYQKALEVLRKNGNWKGLTPAFNERQK